MSCEPQFTSPTRPAFRRHRHCASSTDSCYSCDNTPHYQLTRTQSPLSTTNQLPSSFAHRPPYLPSHILFNEQFNSSQSSLGQSSNYHSSTSHTRYPEPYTDNPFLPLQALRHLRSNEQLVKSPSFQSLASATLSRRKPPPSLVLKDLNPAPLATSNCQVNAPQGQTPGVERRPATRPIVLSDSSQFSHANSNSGESDLVSAYTCHTSLPIELYPANLPQNNHRVGIQSTRTPVIESSRTKSITESRTVDVPDTGLMLRFRSNADIQVSENEGRRWSINDVPGGNEVNEFEQDVREQNVAYGGMSESGPIGKTNLDTAKSQIHADPDKTPTNELEGIPWPSVHASTPALPRKRPPPIYVGNQVQRSTLTQTEMAAAARSNEENASLKLDSPTSINGDGFASPRKLSDASHFSLSMFPLTPTTPNYGDIVRAGLNSANSPLRQTFSPTRESLSAPPVGFAPPFSPRSLQPPSPPHHHRSAPNTPVRRSTAEADHGSFLSYTQNRTKRASADSPAQHQKKAQSIASHHLPASSPKPGNHSPGVARPFPDRERTNTLTSLGSDSVYSQDQDSDSGSCYSDDDDAASMTSSVAEAIMMAQEERRFSRQSRLAYMRDVAMSESAQEPSVESHASLSSDPDSSEQSASPARASLRGPTHCQHYTPDS
ncbi:hypothetical protein FRC12_006014 [Ceratobasidium sp. 428]|nr:hypothetical protein FRC12_006014 [Ceratobasidium sp. 428]